MGYFYINIEKVISDSNLMSCDPTRDIDLILNTDIKNIFISGLTNFRNLHVRKYHTTGYTATKEVTTKKLKLRLSIYDKYREFKSSENSYFRSKLVDEDALMKYFENKYRVEANLKTWHEIRTYCGTTDNSLYNVLISDVNPLQKIFDIIFNDIVIADDQQPKKPNIFQYESYRQLGDALIIEACKNNMCTAKKVLDKYFAKNTNKKVYLESYKKILNGSPEFNENKYVIGQIRNQLIA